MHCSHFVRRGPFANIKKCHTQLGDNVIKPKDRILHILKYLCYHTDEEHYATISDISNYLNQSGVSVSRRTIVGDINALSNYGLDIICNKSRQNQYFIGERHFEIPELKLLVDAVQASRFISIKRSKKLIQKLSSFASVHQVAELNC